MSVFLFPDDSSPVVAFDLTKVETHTFTSTLTKNPVESGATVTDQVVVDPSVFSCVVMISNTPLAKTFEGEGAVGPITFHLPNMPPSTIPFDMLFPSVPGPKPSQATGFQIMNPVDRVKRTLDRLDGLRLAVQTMSVGTSKRFYPSMVITNISMPIEKEQYAEFTITFEQLVIVTTDQVTAPKPKEPRGAQLVKVGSGVTSDNLKAKGEAMVKDFKEKLAARNNESLLFKLFN